MGPQCRNLVARSKSHLSQKKVLRIQHLFNPCILRYHYGNEPIEKGEIMKHLPVVLAILVLVLSACSTPVAPTPQAMQTALAGTMNAINSAATESAAVALTLTAQVTPTETATPSPTVIPPTITPIQPTQPAVMVTALQRVNCRLGVYKFWTSIAILEQGQTAAVTGQNTENGQWWKVLTNAGECWIAGELVSITGDTSKVPTAYSPATPTPVPAPTWGGKWTFRLSSDSHDAEASSQLYTVTLTQSGNQLTGSFTASWSSIYMIGYVSSDGMSVSGELYPAAHPDQQYRFFLFRSSDNRDQFRGYYYIEGDGARGNFCGAVFGTSVPAPCQP